MRSILGWIASLILCSPVLVTVAHAQPGPPPIFNPLNEWYTYRYDSTRAGAQPWASPLSDPAKVGTLHVKWSGPGAPAAVDGPFVNTFAGHDQQHFAYRDKVGVI